MKFSPINESLLKIIVAHRLLEPIPSYLVRKGLKVKINRPPLTLRKQVVYDRWRKDHHDVLPEWVKKVNSPDIFYFKLWDLADLLDELEICQQLIPFVERYDKGLVGKDDEWATSTVKPTGSKPSPSGTQDDAAAAFAAAAAEGDDEAEAAFAAAAAEGDDEAEAAFAAAAAEGDDEAEAAFAAAAEGDDEAEAAFAAAAAEGD